jgi:hypothetical protein
MSSGAREGRYRHHDESRKREVSTMAASITIEEESGTFTGRVHPHNGYYAGDFTSLPHVAPSTWSASITAFDRERF